MALVTSRTELSQGSILSVDAAIWATGTGADIRIHTGGSNNLPALAANEFFEVRDHSLASNNGLYEVVTVNTSTDDYECDKVSGVAPVVSGSETVTTLGATGTSTEKSVMFDVAALHCYILEQGNVDADGVNGQAIYSFIMQEWKDDNFLIANAPFPMNAIDTDAGKYILGQDSSGNNNGWNWQDDAGFSIRTRKLVRNMGWDEIDDAGETTARYASIVTLGTFEDPGADTAFYQFGNDTTVDDTVDFDFAGPVNESVQFFELLADDSVNGGTGVAISTDGRTLTRSDGGNWRTDGFIVGGKIAIRDAENSTNDTLPPETGRTGGFLLSTVDNSVDGDVVVGTAADAGTGFSFIDGGGGNDQIQRFDGGSWLDEGYFVTGNVIVANATTVANDGDYIILAVTDTLIDVATASLTADTADNTATFGPLDDLNTPDVTINVSVNNDNAFRTGLRVRDADPNGKTFGEANLASAGRTVLGNFVFSFPLANATDLKISATDATITGSSPWNAMTITFHSTPQARAGLVGGSFNFGIIVDGNNGTAEEVFEFIQWSLRQLTDIDNDADTAIGRSIGLLARFVGDTLEVGSGDGGLTFPTNPDGGGSGVYIDDLNSASANDVIFYDNTGTARQNPETIAITLDFNQIAIDDTSTQFDLFYDRTIRTSVADFVLTSGAPATLTSAGSNLPNNSELGAGSYVRVSGLTAGDAAMNGVYFILTETTPGDAWDVERYDGVAVVSVTSTAADIDQNCINTPDAIIVDTNVTLTDTTISFTASDTIGDTNSGLAVFLVNDRIRIEGTTSNDGLWEVLTSAAGTLTVQDPSNTGRVIVTEAAGGSFTITTIASGFADADFTFSYDFDGNTQGGRTVSTTTFVQAKAIGSTGAQYVQSPVASIVTGTPVTIPLFAATERNYA